MRVLWLGTLLMTLSVGCAAKKLDDASIATVDHGRTYTYWEGQWDHATGEMYYSGDEFETDYFSSIFIDFRDGVADRDGSYSEAYAQMQGWVDEVDGRIRSGRLSQAVPPPQVVITKNNSINGYISPIRVCFDREL